MLGKLIKYDIKWINKVMVIYYLITFVLCVLTRVLSGFSDNFFLNIIFYAVRGMAIACFANVLINAIIRCWARLHTTTYKDESYLTHTLPVTKSDIYNSKFIQTLIFFVIGFVIILISLFIVYYSKDNWASLREFIKTLTTGLNMSTAFFLIMAITIIFLEVFNAIQCGFLGLILGHKLNNNKIAFSIIFGFIAYLLSQSLVLALVFVYGLFDPTVMELFKTATVSIDVDAFKLLAIISSVLYIIIITVMSIICKIELKKGVNIE